MALIVEDGTGLPNADSWIALADADKFWTDRRQPDWLAAIADAEAGTARREGALRTAFTYLGLVYRYPGQPRLTTQSGPWPRSGVPSGNTWFPIDAIPSQIVQSQLLLAAEALTSNILGRAGGSPLLIEETRTLKGLTKTQRWDVGGVDQQTGLIRLPMVDVLLQGLSISAATGGIGVVDLVRA